MPPPTKGGKRLAKGGKGSGKGKGKGGKGSATGVPPKSGSRAGAPGPKRRAKRRERWSTFIHALLKSVHKDQPTSPGISKRAMTIMGSFVEDIFDRIHTEAVQIAKINKTKTLTAREVQTAARLLLPPELAKHAMAEGTRTVAKYNVSLSREQ
jgi:histone H2B